MELIFCCAKEKNNSVVNIISQEIEKIKICLAGVIIDSGLIPRHILFVYYQVILNTLKIELIVKSS